jgi:hypothetical protein
VAARALRPCAYCGPTQHKFRRGYTLPALWVVWEESEEVVVRQDHQGLMRRLQQDSEDEQHDAAVSGAFRAPDLVPRAGDTRLLRGRRPLAALLACPLYMACGLWWPSL